MEVRKVITLLLGLLLLCLTSLSLAQDNGTSFNPQAANKRLDKISIKLSTENLNINHLEDAIEELSALQSHAKDCVTVTESLLSTTNIQLGDISGVKKRDLTPEQTYLLEKKKDYDKHASECRLFVLRSDETITSLSKAVQSLVAINLFKDEPNLFENLTASAAHPFALFEKFDTGYFSEVSGLRAINLRATIALLLTLLISSFLAIRMRQSLTTRIKQEVAESFYGQLVQSCQCVLKRHGLNLVIAMVFAGFFTVLSLIHGQIFSLTAISIVALSYMLYLMAVRILFYPPEPATGISNLADVNARILARRLNLLGILGLVTGSIYFILQGQEFPVEVARLLRTGFITLLAINLVAVIGLVNRLPKLMYKYRGVRLSLSVFFFFGLLLILTAEWMGFHNLSSYILQGIAVTLSVGLATWFTHKVAMALLDSLSGRQLPWQQVMRQQLGLRRYETMPEIIWLRMVVIAVIWGGFLIVLSRVWGYSDAAMRTVLHSLVDGLSFAGFTIYPIRILSGLLFFTFFVIATRWVRTQLSQSPSMGADRGARIALASVFGYVGLAISLLFALLIAGVNFAGLAIIAGALSVGIGFGLQNIVNNFVSGLILLIERPIKQGDRILVGTTEGFVRKISIRSTIIRSLYRTDVIIPNSDLISGEVTNLMLHDTYTRLSIFVGVAYGSDVELVRKILLAIGEAHEDVLNDEDIKPLALFNQFGDSSLQFELRCVIKNVDRRAPVRSELHFAIDKAFREHNIEIAFPQMDVHVKGKLK